MNLAFFRSISTKSSSIRTSSFLLSVCKNHNNHHYEFNFSNTNNTSIRTYSSANSTTTSHSELLEWYRKLLKRASFIESEGKRKQVFSQLKSEFSNKNSNSSSIGFDWKKKAEESFKFLCMITPKVAPPSKQQQTKAHDGVTQFVKVDGQWQDLKNVDPEKLQKKDSAYLKEASQPPPSACPPGGCGRCQQF